MIISLWNFKKPLDIFSPQIERKRSKEYLVTILAVKESFERFSCLEFVFEKRKHPEAGLKRKQGFSQTLYIVILVFVNENCCLCICFTELFSLSLSRIVSSLFCNFNRCAVCFQSLMNIACKSSQNAARIKRF